MRIVREILLTDYIGAILIAFLLGDVFSVLYSTGADLIAYHFYSLGNSYRPSITYLVLSAFSRVALYLISAYLLARWLYPAARQEIGESTQTEN